MSDCSSGFCSLKDQKCHRCRDLKADKEELLGHLLALTENPQEILDHKDDDIRSLCSHIATVRRAKYPLGVRCEKGSITTPIITSKLLKKRTKEAKEIAEQPQQEAKVEIVDIYPEAEQIRRETRTYPYWEEEPSRLINIISRSILKKGSNIYMIGYNKLTNCYFSLTLQRATKPTEQSKPGAFMRFKVAISDKGSIYNWYFHEFKKGIWQTKPVEAIDRILALKKTDKYVDYAISGELLRQITNLADIWALKQGDVEAKQVQLKNELTTLLQEPGRFPDPTRPPLDPKLVATRINQIRKELDRWNKEIAAKGLPSRSCGHPPPKVEDIHLIPVGCRTIFEDNWRLCSGKDQLDIFATEINSRGNWRTREGELCNPHETENCYNVCIADQENRICKSREEKKEKDQEALLLEVLNLAEPSSATLPPSRKPSKASKSPVRKPSKASKSPVRKPSKASKSPVRKITTLPRTSQTSQLPPKSLSVRTEEEEWADLLDNF